jgi:hypothetical protein
MQKGELLYEYSVNITGITEYGLSFEEFMGGGTLPPEGARFDVYFEGDSTGPKLSGHVKGIDYLRVRADGRFELNIRAEITTPEGSKISLEAGGVCYPQPDSPIAELRENVTLFTCAKDYLWVNPLQIWATGTVNLAEGVVSLKGYSA